MEARKQQLDACLVPIVAALLASPSLDRSTADWATAAGVSEWQFSQLFRRSFDLPFSRWRRQLIIERAQERLEQGVLVSAVARELGYQHTEAFSKSFRMSTGVWPSEWTPDYRAE
jgi:AraC-like DNA-binding protein